jgi:hypothetical protein
VSSTTATAASPSATRWAGLTLRDYLDRGESYLWLILVRHLERRGPRIRAFPNSAGSKRSQGYRLAR